MSSTHRETVAAALLILGGVVALALGSGSRNAAERSAPAGEVERIQQHLATVEQELRLRDVSHLSPAQRAARLQGIEALRRYREAGRFPHNHDFPDRRIPYFVDAHGTLCAMAHLIAQSGRRDIVEAVAAKKNNATVFELAADPELGPVLAEWLEQAGMTVKEAARVQPQYCDAWSCPGPRPGSRAEPVSASQAVTSVLAGGLSVVSSVFNARMRPAGWHGLTGVASGAAAMAAGVANLDRPGARGTLGLVDMAIGVVSTALGVRNLLTTVNEEPVPMERDGPRVRPAVVLVSETGRPAVAVNVSF